ncbi:MAG: hypothetical protein OXU45_07235, partial [Candidatus Melainabacteria bacterium]|nr:hypothetical protein [Candidatus Melainabacteria bacterium]
MNLDSVVDTSFSSLSQLAGKGISIPRILAKFFDKLVAKFATRADDLTFQRDVTNELQSTLIGRTNALTSASKGESCLFSIEPEKPFRHSILGGDIYVYSKFGEAHNNDVLFLEYGINEDLLDKSGILKDEILLRKIVEFIRDPSSDTTGIGQLKQVNFGSDREGEQIYKTGVMAKVFDSGYFGENENDTGNIGSRTEYRLRSELGPKLLESPELSAEDFAAQLDLDDELRTGLLSNNRNGRLGLIRAAFGELVAQLNNNVDPDAVCIGIQDYND